MTVPAQAKRGRVELIHSAKAIPDFADEAEEARFWEAHELAADYQAPPLPENWLPSVRPRSEPPLNMQGHTLRAWRQRLGLSQIELGLALGVPQNTVSRWERGMMPIEHGRILYLALQQLQHQRTGYSSADRGDHKRVRAL
ncbi:MAG: helix-turn-helix domain-containing protein [Dehalococcoidia bacterium]